MINCPVCGRQHNGIQCAWCANDHVQRQMLEIQQGQHFRSSVQQQQPRTPAENRAQWVLAMGLAAFLAWIFGSWAAFGWGALFATVLWLMS